MRDIRRTVLAKKNGRSHLIVVPVFLLLSFMIGCASMSAKEEKQDTSQQAAAAVGQKEITGIVVSGTDPASQTDKILLSANSQLEYTSIKQRDPLGVVFYFPDTTLGQIRPQYTPESDTISSVKTAAAPDQKGARVEVLLKKDSSYKVNRSGNDVEILFSPKGASIEEKALADASPSSQAKDSFAAAKGTNTSTGEFSNSDSAQATKASNKKDSKGSSTTNRIDRIDFSSNESGKSSVIVGTTAPTDYEITKITDRAIKLRVFNSRLPESRQNRPLINKQPTGAIDKISPMQATDANATDFIIELRDLIPYRPVQEGNLITVYFDSTATVSRPAEPVKVSAVQPVQDESSPASGSTQTLSLPNQTKPVEQTALDTAEAKPAATAESTLLPPELQGKKEYTGQKIALDFYETDIKNVFRILQQISGKNYAIDKDVTGEVTISIEKPVPWDQILDLILLMNSLGKKEQGDIVRIARLSTLQREDKEIADKLAAIRKKEDEKKLLDPIETEFVRINYAKAKNEVLPKIQKMITPKRGYVEVDERNNQLIINDTRRVIENMKDVIRQIDKVTPQVLIEARIVEVSEDYERELGISWSASGKDIYRSDLNGQYSYNVAMNTPFTAEPISTNSIDLNFTRLQAWGTPIVLDAALKAMESQNEGKIISTPKILTLDNQAALIKQGTKIPYQELSAEGVPTTKFLDVVLSLDVTPHMTPDRRIALMVHVTKDELLGYGPLGQPQMSVNEANTDLLVEDGETVVIGGVVKTTANKKETGFPILKDIPLLGWMFKSIDDTTAKQELLIFMTPKIVQLEQKDMVQLKK